MDWATLGQQVWNGLANGAVYVLFSLGLTLIYGVLRVINIAQGEFFMLGALTFWSLRKFLEMDFLVALVVSILMIAVLGFICNRLAVRPLLTASPLSTLLSTLAVSYVLINVAIILWPFPQVVKLPWAGGLDLVGINISAASLFSIAAGAIAVTLLHLFVTRVRIGKEIEATAEDIEGAKLVGINVNRIYDLTFAIGAGLAAVGGILAAPLWQASTSMGQLVLLKGFAILVVAGLGSVLGCVVVGLLGGIGEALFGQYISMYYKEGFFYGIMILTLLLRPEGLFAKR